MSPEAPCPRCGKPTQFHDDEMEGVEDGSGACMQCRLELTESGYIMGIAMGVIEPPELEEEEEHE